ncbi:MAG: HNH endonuclease [Promethearchaeota archaeon]
MGKEKVKDNDCGEKLYQNEDWLREKYIEEEMYQREIADMISVSKTTICRWLKIFGIEKDNIKKIQVTCDFCNKTISKYPKRIKRNNHNFCSKECEMKWKSENKSGKDSWNYKKIIVECKYCKENFEVAPYYDKRTKRNFCSQECFGKWLSEEKRGPKHPNWKGGKGATYYGPNWQEQRKKILERDNYTCQKCGKTNDEVTLDIHPCSGKSGRKH